MDLQSPVSDDEITTLKTENGRLTALLAQMVELNQEQEKEHQEQVERLRLSINHSQRVATAFMAIVHQRQKDVPHLYGCTEEQLGDIAEAVIKYTTLGCDFEIIVNAIQENPLIASEWERFTSFLRLAE